MMFLLSVRFLHQRHEQTKQDLKGLEETVVSEIYSAAFICSSERSLTLVGLFFFHITFIVNC